MSSSRGSVPPSPPPPLVLGRRSGRNPGNIGLSKQLSDELSSMLEADDFSIGGYLNKALAVGESGGMGANDIEVERLMAKVALQLQLETQTCHDEIGRIGAELQAILPRCSADINRLAVGLDGMKDDTQGLVENFSSPTKTSEQAIMSVDPNIVQENTASETMKTLSTLHALQLNLEFTKTILDATSSWDTTMSSIPSLLTNQKLSEAVSALTNLQQGARALRGMPGKEQREETIMKFKTQIETLLKPQLLHAFANIETRINLLHQSHHMYKQLGNLDNFVFEYVKNRPADVHKGWFAFTPTLTSAATEEDNAYVDTSKDNSFMQFLPQWYQTILTLLSEERRRTQTVFGNDEASFVTAKILSETFRPITNSFKSRLSSIYASDAKSNQNISESMNDTSTLSYAGSLQTICDAYEATLQFLSLAFGHIANGSNAENTVNFSDEVIPHYQLAQNIYIELASPFTPYQKEFSELEFQHSSLLLARISKDMHAAVRFSNMNGNSIISLDELQVSIDKLEHLAPSVFTIMEDAVTRFELLNCGHNAVQALSTFDKLLSSHTSELSIAISTLSASMISDDDLLADAFDEQHVQYALEVLKLAGRFKEELKKFEIDTRLKLDAQIPEIKAIQGSELFKADDISTDEIATLLATSACCSSDGSRDPKPKIAVGATLKELQHLSGLDCDNAPPILANAYDSTARLAHSCHTFVFDICCAVPIKFLRSVSNMSVWREISSDSTKSSSDMGYEMPTSILPQTYITQVGEHMLALVQALEPFASSPDALFQANQIMGDELVQVAMQPWRDLMDATTLHTGKHLGIEDGDKLVSTILNGKELNNVLSTTWREFDSNFPICPHMEDEHEDEEEEFSKASTAFCNEWLDVIGTAVTGRILERVLRIMRLTDLGAQHLATDLNYILNVFTALGISGHPHPLLKHFENLVSMNKDDLKNRVLLARSMKNDKNKKDLDILLWGAEERIASMRDALP